MKKLIYSLIALPLLFCVSCKEDGDLFDQTYQQRVAAVLVETQETLTEDGAAWLFEYYPHEERTWGGYTYFLSFNKTHVTAEFEAQSAAEGTEEKANKANPSTSLYRMTRIAGPSLSFDAYNLWLHYYAKPSGNSSLYEGRHGDFEFIIMYDKCDENTIVLKGHKYGNIMTMRKVENTFVFADYVAKINEMKNKIRTHNRYLLKISGFNYPIAKLNKFANRPNVHPLDEGRQFTFRPFIRMSEEGIPLYAKDYDKMLVPGVDGAPDEIIDILVGEDAEFKEGYIITDKGIKIYQNLFEKIMSYNEILTESEKEKLLTIVDFVYASGEGEMPKFNCMNAEGEVIATLEYDETI